MAVKLKDNHWHIHVPKAGGWSLSSAFNESIVSHDLAYQMRDKYPDCFLAVTVRNTYDRLWSCYKYSELSKTITFEKFIFEHLISDHSWLGSDGVLRYCWSRDNKNIINYYINFANLQEEFDLLCDYISIPRRKIPHKNSTYYRDYRTCYTPEMIDHVYSHLAQEIDWFGWEFDSPYKMKKCGPTAYELFK